MTAKIDYRARILRILVAYPQGVTANGLIKALPFKCSERTVYNSLREFKRRGLTTLDRYECCDNCQSKIRKHKLTDRGLKEVR
jgi:Fe2+ or Zn2+ uptake regulation protein